MVTTAAAVDQATPMELATHPIFEGVDPAVLAPALGEVRIRRRDAGEPVCGPGARPALHLVLSGRLCLYQLTTEGRRIILDYAQPGGVDGLLELAGAAGHFSAAVEASVVAVIAPPVLDRLAASAPPFAFNLLRVTIRRLRRREQQLERLALRDPEQRIADQLLTLAADWGSDENAARWWAPRVSHEALADMLALRRETVTLHLGRMRRQGAIQVGRRRFELDRRRLEAIRDARPLGEPSAPDRGTGAPAGRRASHGSATEISSAPSAACAWMAVAALSDTRARSSRGRRC